MNKFLPYTIILLLFLFVSEIQGQHYIGLSKDEAKVLARKSGFYPDNLTTNKKFNYLKFVNSADTKTLIVFFTDDDIALHTRTVCGYSEYDFVLNDFNKIYKKKSKNLWEYKIDEHLYVVSLEEKEWYFVLRTKKK